MHYWENCNKNEAIALLRKFVREYEAWYEIKQKEIIKKEDEAAATICLNRINNCIGRLEDGIIELERNEKAWKAFGLMNHAMKLQRVNYAKRNNKVIPSESIQWYSFQLAFILLLIPDITDKTSRWRESVDLLWFNTGGGKTEAYLGVMAFTIFYRRINNGKIGGGTTVMMRYTLRILTTQQFERASSLICACEKIRREHEQEIGEDPITIGLWVGSDVTPNSIKRAKVVIEQIKDGKSVLKENPMQISHCPYCGEPLFATDYKINSGLRIMCPNRGCEYHLGLPIYVIDEEIYEKRPTVLLSTADKFARIVWEEKTKNIFSSDGRYLPPELIIQDELHLISGSLGSLDGIYEAAVEQLCTTKEGIRPKIIASTATVRNATCQIKRLYDRGMFQFPPNGLEIEDSFFARQASKEKRPIRKYVGICETGGNKLDALMRLFATLFWCLDCLKKDGYDQRVIDQYWTIVGYFNTLKDLGSSSIVLMERVESYTEFLRTQKFKKQSEQMGLEGAQIYGNCELTSRKSTSEIRKVLDRLDISYPDERSYSYVLASNMLSVGIDINRLGIMAVYGQPKQHAEYIQATSRVGRKNPGIVFALLSQLNTRDKSQYEAFRYYHQSNYEQVEPTSVTPFSYRAVEKALHAAYVAIVRHREPSLRCNESVSLFRAKDQVPTEAKEYLLKRIRNISEDAVPYARGWLQEYINEWEKRAIESPDNFLYTITPKQKNTYHSLLYSAEEGEQGEFPSTLNSLRNVEPQCNVYIKERRKNE